MNSSKRPQKIKKSHLITLALVFGTALFLRAWQFHYAEAVVELKGVELQVMLAKTPKQWYRGLGQREDLGKFDGMLFLFPFYEDHTLVMRDMKFSIDMIWLSAGKVVDIAPNVPVFPQDKLYVPRVENNAVLELPAGWAKEHNLQIGDTLTPRKK